MNLFQEGSGSGLSACAGIWSRIVSPGESAGLRPVSSQHVHALQPLPELFLDFCLQMPQTRVVPVVQVVAFVPVDLCRGAHGEPFVEEVHQVVHSHPFDPFAEIDHARRGVTDVADDERVDYGFVE